MKAYIIHDTDDREDYGVIVAHDKKTATKILVDSLKGDIEDGWLTKTIILQKYYLEKVVLFMEETK